MCTLRHRLHCLSTALSPLYVERLVTPTTARTMHSMVSRLLASCTAQLDRDAVGAADVVFVCCCFRMRQEKIADAQGRAIREKKSEDPAGFLSRLGCATAVKDMVRREDRDVRAGGSSHHRQSWLSHTLPHCCAALWWSAAGAGATPFELLAIITG